VCARVSLQSFASCQAVPGLALILGVEEGMRRWERVGEQPVAAARIDHLIVR